MANEKYIKEFDLVLRQTLRFLNRQPEISLERRAATMLQCAILAYLAEHRRVTMSDLAQGLEMSLPSSTQLVERLVKAGFVQRRREAADRRLVRILITRPGRQELARLNNLRQEKFRQIFSLISERDQAQLVRIHKIILNKLHALTNKNRKI